MVIITMMIRKTIVIIIVIMIIMIKIILKIIVVIIINNPCHQVIFPLDPPPIITRRMPHEVFLVTKYRYSRCLVDFIRYQ